MKHIYELPAGWKLDVEARLATMAEHIAHCPEELKPLDRPGICRVTVEHIPANSEVKHVVP